MNETQPKTRGARAIHPSEQDHYTQSAEVYDILSGLHWESRRASVRRILELAAGTAGTVLDVGAGTGQGVRIIADALPHCRILAIEPSASMRIGLMTKLLLDDSLRLRTTVAAVSIQDATLPGDLALALVCGCIGYLTKDERLQLWRVLAQSLAPGGFVLADVMAIDRPQVIPTMKAAEVTIGDDLYEVWIAGEPSEDDLMKWEMTCKVRHGDEVLRSFSVTRDWHTFGIRQMVAEAGTAGFAAEPVEDSSVPAVLLRLPGAFATTSGR